jgi:hypothetical protein
MNTPKTPGPLHCPLQTERVAQSTNYEISNNWGQSFENPQVRFGCWLFMKYLTILPVNHESDRVRNELGVAYSDICLEVRKKDTRIASQDSSLRTDIWTLILLNMKHECYRLDRTLRLLCNDVNPLINSTEKSLYCETSTQMVTI